jgi:hypothetical protein
VTYREAAVAVSVGYEVTSGYESLEKVAPNTWKFTGEDHVKSIHDDAEAAEILENTFPGSPAHLIKEGDT